MKNESSESEEKNNEDLVRLNDKIFLIKKDLLMFVGTVFGSSIALSVGKTVNLWFILGEFFLIISVLIGLALIIADLGSMEWSWAFESKNSLTLKMKSSKDNHADFIIKAQEELIKGYDKILKTNQSGLVVKIFTIIKPEELLSLYYFFIIEGIIFILISIVP